MDTAEKKLIKLVGRTAYQRAIGYAAAKRDLLASLGKEDRDEAKRLFEIIDNEDKKYNAAKPKNYGAAAQIYGALNGTLITHEYDVD